MQTVPQPGGALLTDNPTPDTVYDMGNARLYAQCDSTGRILSASLAEGWPLQTMRTVRYLVLNETLAIDLTSARDTARSLAEQFKGTNSEGSGAKQKKMWAAADAQPLEFDTAQALGRTWILSGHCAGLSVTVTTFMDDTNPAVFQ